MGKARYKIGQVVAVNGTYMRVMSYGPRVLESDGPRYHLSYVADGSKGRELRPLTQREVGPSWQRRTSRQGEGKAC